MIQRDQGDTGYSTSQKESSNDPFGAKERFVEELKRSRERGYYYHTINSIVVCQIWTNHRHLIMAIALRRRRNYYYYYVYSSSSSSSSTSSMYIFFIKFLPSSSFIIFFDALLPLRLFVVYTKACFEPEGQTHVGSVGPCSDCTHTYVFHTATTYFITYLEDAKRIHALSAKGATAALVQHAANNAEARFK